MIDFKKIIKAERKRQGKSVREIARTIDCAEQTVYNLEGKREFNPQSSLKILEKILNFLGAELKFKAVKK